MDLFFGGIDVFWDGLVVLFFGILVCVFVFVFFGVFLGFLKLVRLSLCFILVMVDLMNVVGFFVVCGRLLNRFLEWFWRIVFYVVGGCFCDIFEFLGLRFWVVIKVLVCFIIVFVFCIIVCVLYWCCLVLFWGGVFLVGVWLVLEDLFLKSFDFEFVKLFW